MTRLAIEAIKTYRMATGYFDEEPCAGYFVAVNKQEVQGVFKLSGQPASRKKKKGKHLFLKLFENMDLLM